MSLPWHCIEIARGCEIKAPTEMIKRGIRVYIPFEPLEKITSTYADLRPTLRFAPYIFGQLPNGQNILGDDDAKRAGVMSVICDMFGKPRSVPDNAIEAMRAYVPLPKNVAPLRVYRPGQPVLIYTSGISQQAVFIGYERGRGRARVRVWILGAEREAPVAVSQLEPTLDENTKCGAKRA